MSVVFIDYDGGIRAQQDGIESGTCATREEAVLSLRLWQAAEAAMPEGLDDDDHCDMRADLCEALAQCVRDFTPLPPAEGEHLEKPLWAPEADRADWGEPQ